MDQDNEPAGEQAEYNSEAVQTDTVPAEGLMSLKNPRQTRWSSCKERGRGSAISRRRMWQLLRDLVKERVFNLTDGALFSEEAYMSGLYQIPQG